MKNATQKAIEGGWNPYRASITIASTFDSENQPDFVVRSKDKALLDPLFWQALGKAMGWENERVHKCSYNGIDRKGRAEGCSFCEGEGNNGVYWLDVWHRFIDHLAEGKSPDSFFEELLKD